MRVAVSFAAHRVSWTRTRLTADWSDGAERGDLQGIRLELVLLCSGTLCVEFDQPSPMAAVRRTVGDLRAAGYRPVAIERWNVTFCLAR